MNLINPGGLLSNLPPADYCAGAMSVTSDAGFVMSDGTAWVPFGTVRPKSYIDDHTLIVGDIVGVIMNKGTANTLTIPPASEVVFPVGTVITIEQWGAGQTSVAQGVGVTIRSRSGALNLAAQYAIACIRYVGSDEWILAGDLT